MASDNLSEFPKWLKWGMAFIDRVGFPILAFCMMFYMCYVSIEKVNCTMATVVESLGKWQTSTVEFRQRAVDKMGDIIANQGVIKVSLDRLHDKVKVN